MTPNNYFPEPEPEKEGEKEKLAEIGRMMRLLAAINQNPEEEITYTLGEQNVWLG